MKLTTLSAAPAVAPQAALPLEVSPQARATYGTDAGAASQLKPGFRRTRIGR
jgi:hypothetical protein